MWGGPPTRLVLPAFAQAVVEGLSQAQKCIPSTWLYDQRGSELFEQITELPEYYPTRTEIGILERHLPELARAVGTHTAVVEFGSGSARKTRLLLAALACPQAYVPIDISTEFLLASAAEMAERFPGLRVEPVTGDFMGEVQLPAWLEGCSAPRLGFFPGSTIGNFTPDQARRFLARTRRLLGPRAWLLIGVDTTRDPDVLIPAYDDAQGVTAAFNLNLLARMNRELAADFQLEHFAHAVRYLEEPTDPLCATRQGHVEMHLVSSRDQDVRVAGRDFHFLAQESIHTENSYKYAPEAFLDLATQAGWSRAQRWMDADSRFTVALLRASGADPGSPDGT